MATVDEVFALDLDVKAAVLGRLMEIMEEREAPTLVAQWAEIYATIADAETVRPHGL